jgi:hypothetical protein
MVFRPHGIRTTDAGNGRAPIPSFFSDPVETASLVRCSADPLVPGLVLALS